MASIEELTRKYHAARLVSKAVTHGWIGDRVKLLSALHPSLSEAALYKMASQEVEEEGGKICDLILEQQKKSN